MNGELAQLVALAAHGTHFLQGGGATPELFPEHTTFQHVEDVEFRITELRFSVPAERVVGRSTGEWFEELRRSRTVRLALERNVGRRWKGDLPPHIEVGFSNGLDVALLSTTSDDDRTQWSASWQVNESRDPSKRAWSVRYVGAYGGGDGSEGGATASVLSPAGNRLGSALESAEELAKANSWSDWEAVFARASQLLTSASPEIPYYPDLLPRSSGLQPRQVLAAACAGWVFGGMGSWNDLVPHDERSYAAVTAELYEAVSEAVVAATNHASE